MSIVSTQHISSSLYKMLPPGQSRGRVAVNTFHLFCGNCTGCPTPCRLQTGNTDVQVATWLHTVVSLRLCKSAPEASRRLRSSGAITCVIPWSTRTRLGDRSFDVAGPRLWNKLPASLRSSDSFCQFRRQLKTFLFDKD